MSDDTRKHGASTARSVAAHVLYRVAKEGAYASVCLDHELRRANLSERDRALATQIVYGTLRAIPYLDQAIQRQLRKPIARLDELAHAALRTAVYQLLFLQGVQPHGVLNETVQWVKHKRGKTLSGLVNAVLRGLTRSPPMPNSLPAPHPELDKHRTVVPDWLAQRLIEDLGAQRAECFRSRAVLPPPVCIRVRPSSANVSQSSSTNAPTNSPTNSSTTSDPKNDAKVHWLEALREHELHLGRPTSRVELRTVARDAVYVSGGGDPRSWPGFEQGAFVVQEEGSQLIVELCDAPPGAHVADVCAGHGGKSLALLDAIGARGHLTAADVHARKLEEFASECHRLGISDRRYTIAPIDLSVGIGDLQPSSMDLVLVDAPCTGLGTIHRRPEILLRVQPHDPARMAELQLRILRNAARLVRPSGVLVYAVCSPTREEGHGVAHAFDRASNHATEQQREPEQKTEHAHWTRMMPTHPRVRADADGVIRLGPWTRMTSSETGSVDMYQVVLWRRNHS